MPCHPASSYLLPPYSRPHSTRRCSRSLARRMGYPLQAFVVEFKLFPRRAHAAREGAASGVAGGLAPAVDGVLAYGTPAHPVDKRPCALSHLALRGALGRG